MGDLALGALIGVGGVLVGAIIGALISNQLEVRRERRRRREDIMFNLRRLLLRLTLETSGTVLAAEDAKMTDKKRGPQISSEMYEKATSIIIDMMPDFLFYASCARHIIDWKAIKQFEDKLYSFYSSKKIEMLGELVQTSDLVVDMIDKKLKLKGPV